MCALSKKVISTKPSRHSICMLSMPLNLRIKIIKFELLFIYGALFISPSRLFAKEMSVPYRVSRNKLSILQPCLRSISIDYINSSLLPNSGRNQQICNYTMLPKAGNVCAVDINNWGPCSPSQQYGFNNSAPCIFIKLNRVRTSILSRKSIHLS